MTIDQLLDALDAPADRNRALELLESVVVDRDDRLMRCLVGIIGQPDSIQDTNRFASLLTDLGADAFIKPLVICIGSATPGQSTWLSDYMYALGSLLMNREEPYPADEAFVHRLGDWVFSTGGGEVSWKAGEILAELQHPATRSYLVRGVSAIREAAIDAQRHLRTIE
jgi:hypothetical protein